MSDATVTRGGKSGFLSRGYPLFRNNISAMLRDRKTKLMISLCFLGMLIAVAIAVGAPELVDTPAKFAAEFTNIVRHLYFNIFVIFVALLLASSQIVDEKRNETMPYLLTRPIPRSEIFIHKYLSYLVVSFLILIGPVIGIFFILGAAAGGDAISTHADLLPAALFIMLVQCAYFGAIFITFGTYMDNPLFLGFIIAFGLSMIAQNPLLFGPNAGLLVPTYHIDILTLELMPYGTITEISNPASISAAGGAIIVMALLMFFLGLMKIRKKDFP
jgi:ABC-type transport system involved in multi-copper enzyme maturation permease subunit